MSTRALTAAVSAVLTVGITVAAADAAPPAAHGKGHVKAAGKSAGQGQAKGAASKLAKHVVATERALDRAVRPARIARLSAESVSALQANVAADKTLLATFISFDQLATFRAGNYVVVVNVVRDAEALLTTTDPASPNAALLEAVVAKALTVTASSPKSLLDELRADVEAASPVEDVVEPVTPVAP